MANSELVKYLKTKFPQFKQKEISDLIKLFFDEIKDALKRGQAKGLATVTNSLFTSATDGNVTAQIFYLKNQDPKNWKDRQETVHATINLNDVLSGAKDRIDGYMTDRKEPKIINAVKSTSQDMGKQVINQIKKDNK